MKRILFGLLLTLPAAFAQSSTEGWKNYSDAGGACVVSVPADWGKKQGELFIRDSSNQARVLIMSSSDRFSTVRRSVKESLQTTQIRVIRDQTNSFLYQYKTAEGTVGYYKGITVGDKVCKLQKSVAPELAPMLEEVLLQIAGTLRPK